MEAPDFDGFLERCHSLPYRFPRGSDLVQLSNLPAEDCQSFVECAAGTHPLADGKLTSLLQGFLALKRARGSPPEKAVYASLSVCGLVDRLLRKRPLTFYTSRDKHLLRTGQYNSEAATQFEAIGSAEEERPFVLEDLMSYEEMPLAALLGVWVPTLFINDGDRYTMCNTTVKPYQRRGVICGLVGARLAFENGRSQMEAKHMLVSSAQNDVANGYGADAPDTPPAALLKLWARFYGLTHFPSYAEALQDDSGRYLAISFLCCQCRCDVDGPEYVVSGYSYCRSCMQDWYGGDMPINPNPVSFLDVQVFKERIRLVVEPFLARADQAARMQDRLAYCRVKGLGLGCWQIDSRQEDLMLAVYAEILTRRSLQHVAAVDFAHFPKATSIQGVENGDVFPGTTVQIFFTKDGLASPARADLGRGDLLLCAMYAWDSNAWPGNEWWFGHLGMTDDSAAASCSYISTLQNPDVNPRVAGRNLLLLSVDDFVPVSDDAGAR